MLSEAEVALHRRPPAAREEVKAVLLLRADRPMWSHKRLVNVLHEAGVRDVRITAVTAHTAFGRHVDLWSSADLIISDDHDALTGQTLMQPGTGVIEIFPPLISSTDHALLAEKTGVHYVGLESDTLVPAELVAKREATAMSAFQEARSFFDNNTTAHKCQADEACMTAMLGIGTHVERGLFTAALEDMLRQVVVSRKHGCMDH